MGEGRAAGEGGQLPAKWRPLTVRLWVETLAAATAGVLVMVLVASLGLWAADADSMPGGGFHRVVAAVVVMAAGGTVEVVADAGIVAASDAAVDVVPLSVTVAGALALALVFLWPLRHRAVAPPAELLGRIALTAAFWLVWLGVLAAVARHDFEIPVGEGIAEELGREFGLTPRVGFRADVPATLGVGLLWVLAVLALAVLVPRGTPLPARLLRFQRLVRPPAFAMVFALLAYVALGLVAGVVALFTEGHPAETFAVLCLGLPNLVWMAFGIGVGGAWKGRVDDTLGLPMPQVLDKILHTREGRRTLDLGAVAEHDGRAWLLVAVAAAVLLTAAYCAAVRAPAHLPAWRHALQLAAALALTLLVVGLLTRLSARQGLSLVGVGDLSGITGGLGGGKLGGEVDVQPDLLRLVGAGAVWGLVSGFVGSLLARGVRHPGEVEGDGT